MLIFRKRNDPDRPDDAWPLDHWGSIAESLRIGGAHLPHPPRLQMTRPADSDTQKRRAWFPKPCEKLLALEPHGPSARKLCPASKSSQDRQAIPARRAREAPLRRGNGLTGS